MTLNKIAILVFCFFIWAAPVLATNFSTLIEDLPIMQGLTEDTHESVVFDKPSGRFVELYTYGSTIQTEEIERFYNQALPALGWLKKGHNFFHRGAEGLKISIDQQDNFIAVIFTLTPL